MVAFMLVDHSRKAFDNFLMVIPSFIIGLRPCFAIPASASSGLGIELFAMVFLTVRDLLL